MTSRWCKPKGSFLSRVIHAALLTLIAGTGAAFAATPQQRAWDILRSGVNPTNTAKRVPAVRALRLLPRDSEGREMAEAALRDRKPEVRAAAATTLGLMGSKEAIPALKSALSDKPAVVLAAAHALPTLNDSSGRTVRKDRKLCSTTILPLGASASLQMHCCHTLLPASQDL